MILNSFPFCLDLPVLYHSLVHTTLLKRLISSREHSESEFRYLDERSVNELLGQAHSITCIFQKLEYLWSKKEISENSKVNTNGTLFTWTILQSMDSILAFISSQVSFCSYRNFFYFTLFTVYILMIVLFIHYLSKIAARQSKLCNFKTVSTIRNFF